MKKIMIQRKNTSNFLSLVKMKNVVSKLGSKNYNSSFSFLFASGRGELIFVILSPKG